MFKYLFRKKQSVVFTWLLSYMAILLIPIAIAGFMYIEAERVIESETNKSNTFLLKRVRQQMDDIHEDINKLYLEVAFNPRIMEIMNIGSYPSNVQQYTMAKAVDDLSLHKISGNSFYTFYIYFHNIDIVLSHNTGADSESFYHTYNEFDGSTYEEWLEIHKKMYSGDYVSIPGKTGKAGGSRLITYFRSLPIEKNKEKAATLVIMIPESEFVKDAEGINITGEGAVFIMDGTNQIIASTEYPILPVSLQYDDFSEANGSIYEEINGNPYVITYIPSDNSDWKYVSAIPERIFWEKAEYIRRLAATALLLCLLLGGALSWFLVKKSYNPLSELIKSLKDSTSLEIGQKGNEYDFLNRVVSKALDEKKELSNIVRRQTRDLQASFICGLLKGREVPGVPVEDLLTVHDLAFASEYFAVIIFYVDNLESLLKENSNDDPVKVYSLLRFIITNVVEELINRKNIGFVAEVDDLMACLVNLRESGADDWKSELSKVMSEVGSFLYKHYNMKLVMSVSSLHRTAAGIRDAYDEALQAMQYRKIINTEKAIFFEEITGLPKGAYYYPMEKEYQILNCIKAGDIKRAKILLEEIFQKNFDDTLLSVQTATCLMYDLVSTMIKALYEIGDEGRNAFLNELGPVEVVLNCATVNEMKCRMMDVIEKFCRHIGEKSRSNTLDERVKQYVGKHYRDVNLSVSAIAEHFGVHPVYMSREFKEKVGMGLSDYINRIRTDKAKKLLDNRELNMEQIAKDVGYSNVRTFTRAFTRNEGTTPGKFRGED